MEGDGGDDGGHGDIDKIIKDVVYRAICEVRRIELRCERELVRMERELMNANKERSKAEKECLDLEASVLLSSEEFAKVHASANSSARLARNLQVQLDTANRNFQKSQEQLELAQSLADSRRNELERAQTQLRQLSEQISDLVQWRGTTDSALQRAFADANKAAQEFDGERKENAQLAARIDILEADRCRLRAELADAKSTIQEQESLVESVTTKHAERVKNLQASVASLESEIDSLKEQLSRQSRELEESKHQLSHHELQNAREVRQLTELCELYKEAVSAAEEKSKKLEKLVETTAGAVVDSDLSKDARADQDRNKGVTKERPLMMRSRKRARNSGDISDDDLENDKSELRAELDKERSLRHRAENLLTVIQHELENGAEELQAQARQYQRALQNESRLSVQLQAVIREKENALQIARDSQLRMQSAEQTTSELRSRVAELERAIIFASPHDQEESGAMFGSSPSPGIDAEPTTIGRRSVKELRYQQASPHTPPMKNSAWSAQDTPGLSSEAVYRTPGERALAAAAAELNSAQKRQQELMIALIAQRDIYRDMATLPSK